MENWKEIPGYEGLYEVSDCGSVRSVTRTVGGGSGPRVFPGRARKQAVATSGYLCVSLSKGGKVSVKNVHTLVLEAFVGDRPPGFDACHCDGDRLNNHVDNLRWDTRLENIRDKETHGTNLKGSAVPASKLAEHQVKEIKRQLAAGTKQTVVARQFGVALETIHAIKTGRTWRHVDAR